MTLLLCSCFFHVGISNSVGLNQGHGLVLMANMLRSYHAQVVGAEDTCFVQSVGWIAPDQPVHNAMEKYVFIFICSIIITFVYDVSFT
jgi:hypothetical protein